MADHDGDTTIQTWAALTKRESDILALLAQGLSDNEIAERLVIAVNTVKWYNRQIYSKLGVSNRRQAVERAYAGTMSTRGLPSAPPRHNLPAHTTPFVGRMNELDGLAHLLLKNEPNRLITLLAPGGMGKTRLALAAAEACLSQFADGVYFVPLASLMSPEQLLTAIADAVGFQLTAERRSPRQQIFGFLHDKSTLLVLDNFEHLVEGATLLADMLEAAPYLHLLATSRERLNLICETVYPLGGMEYPDSPDTESALEYSAVQLFIECSQRLAPQTTLEDTASIIQVCQLTQGMPLAIELASAQLVALSPAEIASEIVRSLDLLQTNMRDVPERQRSIRAVFQATWQRLSSEERKVMRWLSVFRGGFTRDAAQAVCETTTRTLVSLANKALIAPHPNRNRYEIHELLRQFAEEQLSQSGDTEAVFDRHAAYFADFLDARLPALQSQTPNTALEEIQIDFDNIRPAILHALDVELSVPLESVMESLRLFFEADVHFSASVHHPGLPYLNLRSFFEARAHYNDDALLIFRKALASAYPPEVEAILHEGLGDALQVTVDYERARQEYEHAARVLPPDALIQRARLLRKRAATLNAQQRLEEALDVLAEAEDSLESDAERDEAWWHEWIAVQNGIVSAYFFLGTREQILEGMDRIRAAVEQHGTPTERFDFYISANMTELLQTRFLVTERAMAHARLGLAAAKESGGALQIATAHFRLALTHFVLEDWTTAETDLRTSLAISERIGNVLMQAICTSFMALMFRRCNQVAATENWANLTLRIASSAGIELYIAAAKANLGWVAWRSNDIERALALANEALAIWERVSPYYPARWQAHWILLGNALRENRLADAVSYAREILPQQVPSERIVLPLTGAIEAWTAGNGPEAEATFSEVAAIAVSLGYL